MPTPSHDPSFEHEPHLRSGGFRPDPSEQHAGRNLDWEAEDQTEDDRVDHSVWDEPGLSTELAGKPPPEALTYASWLDSKVARMTPETSWLATLLIALAAGPWAILTAFWGGSQHSVASVVNLTLIGPLLEELGKIGVALFFVERRPYLFCSRLQLAFCALAGGFVFAAIENLLYLAVYIQQPTLELVYWRWTVCIALHMGCALVASLGLMRIWVRTMTDRTKPQLALGLPYLLTAMVIHGVYNGLALLLQLTRFGF